MNEWNPNGKFIEYKRKNDLWYIHRVTDLFEKFAITHLYLMS